MDCVPLSASLLLLATVPSLIVGAGLYVALRARPHRPARDDAPAARKVFLVRLGLPEPPVARAVPKR
jgi:hypothetical protein